MQNKRVLLISIVLLFLSLKSFGQWSVLSMPINNNFVDIQFINDSVGFISGEGGAFLKTSDAGVNWQNINTTSSVSTFRFHFPDDSIGYALAHNSLFKTIDQGTTWLSLPNLSTFDKKNLFFINDSTGFFLTAYGTIFKTSDGGMNWLPISTNCTSTIVEEDIYFPDENTGYFCGWYSTCASRTTDGGNSWQVLNGNLLYVIMSIHFPSVSTGFMTGWNTPITSGIQKTEDSGITWTLLNTPQTMYFSIYCTDTLTCYAVGPNGEIIKTADGGTNWLQQASGTTKALKKIFCIDANTCYAVGDSGIVLKTSNGGLTGLSNNLNNNTKLVVYPNPADKKITLQLTVPEFEIKIYNALGKCLYTDKNQSEIDVSEFPDGVYFIEIISKEMLSYEKLIVSHF